MLVAMAGLPGTGKSWLAARIAAAVGGAVLSKDAVRAALFPPPMIDYSAAQDDLAMDAVYAAATLVLRNRPNFTMILDGRTFSRRDHLARLFAVAAAVPRAVKLIECVCPDDVVRTRLAGDAAAGGHPAGNRTFELYLARKAAADPITVPRLVVDTAALAPDELTARCLRYLSAG